MRDERIIHPALAYLSTEHATLNEPPGVTPQVSFLEFKVCFSGAGETVAPTRFFPLPYKIGILAKIREYSHASLQQTEEYPVLLFVCKAQEVFASK